MKFIWQGTWLPARRGPVPASPSCTGSCHSSYTLHAASLEHSNHAFFARLSLCTFAPVPRPLCQGMPYILSSNSQGIFSSDDFPSSRVGGFLFCPPLLPTGSSALTCLFLRVEGSLPHSLRKGSVPFIQRSPEQQLVHYTSEALGQRLLIEVHAHMGNSKMPHLLGTEGMDCVCMHWIN